MPPTLAVPYVHAGVCTDPQPTAPVEAQKVGFGRRQAVADAEMARLDAVSRHFEPADAQRIAIAHPQSAIRPLRQVRHVILQQTVGLPELGPAAVLITCE